MGETTGQGHRQERALAGIAAVLLVIFGFWALRGTYILVVPLAFSVFLAMIVRPIQQAIRRRTPRRLKWLGTTAAMLAAVAGFAALVAMLWLAIAHMADMAPEYADRFKHYWQAILGWAQSHGIDVGSSAGSTAAIQQHITAIATQVLAYSGQELTVLALIFFYTLLMLIELGDWQEKVEAAFTDHKSATVVRTVDVIAYRIQRYLALRTAGSAVAAVLEGGWLWLMGVDFAFAWAVLIFLGNYVPNIGTTLSFIPPSTVAILQFGLLRGVLIIVVLFVIDQVLNNYVVPVWFGSTLRISPLVLLFALVFWTWLWGASGALLAIPMTVSAVIICANVKALSPVARLLAGSADDEVATKKVKKEPSPVKKLKD